MRRAEIEFIRFVRARTDITPADYKKIVCYVHILHMLVGKITQKILFKCHREEMSRPDQKSFHDT